VPTISIVGEDASHESRGVVAPTAVKSKRPQDKTGMLVPAASSARPLHCRNTLTSAAFCSLRAHFSVKMRRIVRYLLLLLLLKPTHSDAARAADTN